MEPSEILVLVVGALVLLIFDSPDSDDSDESDSESDEDEEN